MHRQVEYERALSVAHRMAEQWGFRWLHELSPGHCSRVFADEGFVLKVPWQGEETTSGLVAAINLSGGLGPKVIHSDPTTGALLMERVCPGTKLLDSGLGEMDCRVIFAELIRQLPTKPVGGLIPVGEFHDGRGPDSIRPRWLHGDLHHENILWSGSEWKVIDPKGLVGDLEYEFIAFMRNPLGQLPAGRELRELVLDRLAWVVSEFGVDKHRLLQWLILNQTDEGKLTELGEVASLLLKKVK